MYEECAGVMYAQLNIQLGIHETKKCAEWECALLHSSPYITTSFDSPSSDDCVIIVHQRKPGNDFDGWRFQFKQNRFTSPVDYVPIYD